MSKTAPTTKIARGFRQAAAHAIVLLLLASVMLPLYFMLIKSVKTPDQDVVAPFALTFPFFWENYNLAWIFVKDLILNTVIIAVSQTVGLLLVCSLASYAFTRFRFPFKKTIATAILALMMIPGTLTLIPQFQLVNKMQLFNNFAGVILPSITASIPLGIFLLNTFFAGLPKDLFEAAEIDGARHVYQYFKIALPLSLPILATLGLMHFMGAWNDLLWPTIILTDEAMHTITVGLVPFTEMQWEMTQSFGIAFAGYAIVSVPLLALFALLSKQFIKGLTSGAFKL